MITYAYLLKFQIPELHQKRCWFWMECPYLHFTNIHTLHWSRVPVYFTTQNLNRIYLDYMAYIYWTYSILWALSQKPCIISFLCIWSHTPLVFLQKLHFTWKLFPSLLINYLFSYIVSCLTSNLLWKDFSVCQSISFFVLLYQWHMSYWNILREHISRKFKATDSVKLSMLFVLLPIV